MNKHEQMPAPLPVDGFVVRMACDKENSTGDETRMRNSQLPEDALASPEHVVTVRGGGFDVGTRRIGRIPSPASSCSSVLASRAGWPWFALRMGDCQGESEK
jgi:hypothetical protein